MTNPVAQNDSRDSTTRSRNIVDEIFGSGQRTFLVIKGLALFSDHSCNANSSFDRAFGGSSLRRKDWAPPVGPTRWAEKMVDKTNTILLFK